MASSTSSPVDRNSGAVTREFVPNRAEVREQLARLLDSSLFRTSRRYPGLLRYIVERKLDGRTELLKERTLGVEVFGRRADYDTNHDPRQLPTRPTSGPTHSPRQSVYGPANFDRRQVLALNYVVNTPNLTSANRFARALANGWQLSGVTQIATGAPFTPTFTISGVSSQNITGNVVAGNPAPGAASNVYEGAESVT